MDTDCIFDAKARVWGIGIPIKRLTRRYAAAIKWRYGNTRVDLALERLTLSYNEMLRGKNTGRDRKKVKKLIYYYLELIKKRVTNGQIAFFVLYGKCI